MKTSTVEYLEKRIAPATIFVTNLLDDRVTPPPGSLRYGLTQNIPPEGRTIVFDVGGTIHSKIHMDGVLLEPTLYVDGDKRIENGKFLRPVEGPA